MFVGSSITKRKECYHAANYLVRSLSSNDWIYSVLPLFAFSQKQNKSAENK